MLGFFLLFFCIRINQINLNLSFLTLSLITISCSICILYSLWFFISTTTIWFVKTWNATEVLRSFLYLGRFPLNSFSFSLRIFFSVFIPIAFITTIPSEVILGIFQLWKIFLKSVDLMDTLRLKELKKTVKNRLWKKIISLKINYLSFEAESTLSSFFTSFSLSSRCFS